MNILINFSTIKKGGGQNVAINFLLSLKQIELKDKLMFVVSKGSPIDKLTSTLNFKCIQFSSNPILRIFQEVLILPKIISDNAINIVYSYFGYTLLNKKKYIQVSGIAVSNIFFPEIDFWSEYKGFQLLKRKIIDLYRIKGVQRAHGLIFENEGLKIRASKLYGVCENQTSYILPSVNRITNTDNNSDFTQKNRLLSKKVRLLFLCGWQLNKNVLKIPELAYELSKNELNFEIVLTAPKDNSNIHKEFSFRVEQFGVKEFINHIGSVEKINLPQLYQSINFVMLLSKLESFSNNIIEAWFYKRILVITDSEWSKSICDKSAIYVDRNNTIKIAEVIQSITSFENLETKRVVLNGIEKLKQFPTIEEKTKLEFAFIEKIHERSKII